MSAVVPARSPLARPAAVAPRSPVRRVRRLGGIFPYFGGDSRWAGKIVDMLPKGKRLVEVFGGSAAVTVEAARRGKYGEYVLNDKDPYIYIAYSEILRNPKKALEEAKIVSNISLKLKAIKDKNMIKRIVDRLREKFNEYIKQLKNPILVNALAVVMKRRLMMRTKGTIGQFDKIRSIIRLFREAGVKAENKDWKDVLREHDSPDTVFYLDPPHTDNPAYRHNFTVRDAEELAKALAGLKGRWLLKISPHDWETVYSKYLGKFKVVRFKYKGNFNVNTRGKEKELVFVVKD